MKTSNALNFEHKFAEYASDALTEVEAYDDITGAYYWVHKTEATPARNGNQWLVKDGTELSSDQLAIQL